MDLVKYCTGVTVEALSIVIVSDLTNGLANDLLEVYGSCGGDLTHEHNDACSGGSLASNARHGVLLEKSVENCVGYLVADLIGMSLGYGLGSEKMFCHFYILHIIFLVTERKPSEIPRVKKHYEALISSDLAPYTS